MKKSELKKIINAFTTNDIEKVIEYHIVYGDKVFEIRNGRNYRLIFYSFLNSNFDIINYYLSIENKIKLSSSETFALSRKLAHKNRFLNWFEILKTNKMLSSFINYEYFLANLEEELVHIYDSYEELENYLNLIPDENKEQKIEELIKRCSENKNGSRIKRHLTLSKLV